MKNLLIGLLVLGSFSALATECTLVNSLKRKVCADVRVQGEELIIKNITPNIQKKRSVAKEICESFGDGFSDYKAEITTMKACSYFSTKGFFAGGMVSACLDFGGLSRGTVFSKIKCTIKQ